MSRRGAHPGLAALASLASLLGLTTLVATQTWYARTIWLVILAVGLGVLVRRFTAGSGRGVIPVQVLGVLLCATWMFAASTTWYGLPTLATVRRYGVLFTEFATTAAESAAPMPANAGVEATLALIGVALAILVEALAVTRAAPAAAGLPLLTAFLAAAANNGSALPPFYFLVAAFTWLLMLGQHAQSHMRRWASTPARPLAPAASSGPAAAPELRFGVLARRLGATGLIAAVLLASVLPHLPPRYLLDGLARSADGRGNAKVGFSSTLDVGLSLTSAGTGRILTYRTNAGSAAPLRVLAATAYDDKNWTSPAPTFGRSARLNLAESVPRSERTIIVESNGLDPPALATPQPITAADLSGVSWQVDEVTSDVYVQTRPGSYSTTYLEPLFTADLLRNGVDGVAGPDRLPNTRGISAALEVTSRSRAAVAAATATVTASSPTPYDAAVAIQDWLRNTGGFSYSLALAEPPVSNGVQLDPISAFLATKRGYCVQFASAMVMMSRAAGIPARMAIGFLPGSQQEGLWTVTGADAHAWPELYFPGAGWVRFEPTPSVRTGAAPAWTIPTPVPGPLPTSTARATDDPIDRATRTPQDGLDDGATTTTLDRPVLEKIFGWLFQGSHSLLLVIALVVLATLVLPVTAAILRRIRTRHGGVPAVLIESQWERLTTEMDDLGVPALSGGTLRDTQAHYVRAGFLDEPARLSLSRVVDNVERARYARPGAALATDLHEDTALVRREVARTRDWRHRLRAALLPTDARRWWAAAGRAWWRGPRTLWARLRR